MKHFIGGYEVSSETYLEYERQNARNRQHEIYQAQECEKLRLLKEQNELLKSLASAKS